MYVDKTLPFGLRSAPLIFSALADALAWIMKQKGVSFVDHYIDDFVTVGRPGAQECHNNLQMMLRTCEDTGTPVDPGKTEGPCPSVPGNRSGHNSHATETASRKVIESQIIDGEVAGQESLQEERPTLHDWGTLTCMQSGQAGMFLLMEAH